MGDCTQKANKAPEGNRRQETSAAEPTQRVLGRLSERIDLEGSARYSGALQRKRVIQSAQHLLRMVWMYALTDCSLQMVGMWATLMGWGSLCKNGVRKRLCQCQGWLGMLIVQVLLWGKLSYPQRAGLRLRLFDASTVVWHRSTWRLHLGFDLSAGRMTDVALTDQRQGESLTRWEFAPQEICLADRYSGNVRSLGVLLGALAYFVIRIGWQNLPLQTADGQPFALSTWLRVQSTDPAATPAQVMLWVVTPQGRFAVRVVARAIPPDKAERIRQKLRAEAKHKKKRIDERTLLAAGFVMLVSNLPAAEWCAADILALYRFRWQIELVFKRLKSLLTFDHLRATDPQLAQVYLLSKILIALLLEEAEWQLALLAPDTFHLPDRPVSRWRLTQLLLAAFRQAVCGSLSWQHIQAGLPQLDRYLCDEPRRRQKQLVTLGMFGVVCGY